MKHPISLCSAGLSAGQPAVFFSLTKSASITGQQPPPAVLFSYNKPGPITNHSQPNTNTRMPKKSVKR